MSPCQTQTGPNETQTNLLTGFVSLQTDISWQPERNICENEILDPHVTAGCHMAESRRQFCRNIFSSRSCIFSGCMSSQFAADLHIFFFFGFNLKFVRWAAGEGGACKFCAIEGRILLRKWFRLIFGTILVEPRGFNANCKFFLG